MRMCRVTIGTLALLLMAHVSLAQLPTPRVDGTTQGAIIYSQLFPADATVRTYAWPYSGPRRFAIKSIRVWMGVDSSILGDLFALVTRQSDGSVLSYCGIDHYAQWTSLHFCDMSFPDGFVLDPGDTLHLQTSVTPFTGGGSGHTIVTVWGVYLKT